MKLVLLLTGLLLRVTMYSQSTATDSCAIAPLYTASIEGVEEKGMLSVNDVWKFKKLLPSDKNTTIIRFTLSIDCDKCELFLKEVYSDSLSADDRQRISKMSIGNVISFECIVGKNGKGELVSYKPFLFYIKP